MARRGKGKGTIDTVMSSGIAHRGGKGKRGKKRGGKKRK